VQGDLRLIGLLKGPDPVRGDILASFGDDEEKAVKAAIKWAWLHRRVKMDQRVAAVHIGVQAAHLSNILNGKKHLPPHKINAFEWVVGNRAVTMTIERFRTIREEESALDLARAIVATQRTGTA
jgi:plasmid maintenance system antidote protein VapI